MKQKVQREGKAQAGIESTLVCVTQGRRKEVREFQRTISVKCFHMNQAHLVTHSFTIYLLYR